MGLIISRGKEPRPQKVVLYGPEGIGKTTLAAQFPSPVFIDTEGGTQNYDVARVAPPKDWDELLEVLELLAGPDGSEFATVVLDTADWAEALCAQHLIAYYSWQSIETPGYGKGYTMLAEEFGKLLSALDKLAVAGMNAVVVAHSATRKFEQPDEAAAYDRYELKLQKKVAPLVKEWADALLFLNWKAIVEVVGEGFAAKGKARNAKRVMNCQHHACWDAKNRWSLPAEVDMDYAVIAPFIPARETSAPAAPADSLSELMERDGVSVDEVAAVAVSLGNVPEGTAFEELPAEYGEFVAANWSAFVERVHELRARASVDEPVPFE